MGKTADRPSYPAWYEANRERLAAKHKAWETANRDKIRLNRAKHREQRSAYAAARYQADPEKWKARAQAAKQRARAAILDHYGRACACCGEAHTEFLALDHINGGGNEHRATTGTRGGSAFYRWIAKNGFPDGYRILCHNCNMARGLYGYCPHEATVSV